MPYSIALFVVLNITLFFRLHSTSYNKLCGLIQQLAAKLKASLGPDDPFCIAMTDKLLDKLYRMGLINTTKSLQKAEEISASAFC
jgi:U3 small nucleolar ribonucleoprotein protein IMP3